MILNGCLFHVFGCPKEKMSATYYKLQQAPRFLVLLPTVNSCKKIKKLKRKTAHESYESNILLQNASNNIITFIQTLKPKLSSNHLSKQISITSNSWWKTSVELLVQRPISWICFPHLTKKCVFCTTPRDGGGAPRHSWFSRSEIPWLHLSES